MATSMTKLDATRGARRRHPRTKLLPSRKPKLAPKVILRKRTEMYWFTDEDGLHIWTEET
jgi:hypothetical protein